MSLGEFVHPGARGDTGGLDDMLALSCRRNSDEMWAYGARLRKIAAHGAYGRPAVRSFSSLRHQTSLGG